MFLVRRLAILIYIYILRTNRAVCIQYMLKGKQNERNLEGRVDWRKITKRWRERKSFSQTTSQRLSEATSVRRQQLWRNSQPINQEQEQRMVWRNNTLIERRRRRRRRRRKKQKKKRVYLWVLLVQSERPHSTCETIPSVHSRIVPKS
jgi:hypothetical protein